MSAAIYTNQSTHIWKTVPAVQEAQSGGSTRVWHSTWKRRAMTFEMNVRLRLDVVFSGTMSIQRAATAKTILPVFTEQDREEVVAAVMAKIRRDESIRAAAERERVSLEVLSRQADDEEELFSLALMLLD
jgi:hypothetical protein